MGQRDPQIKRLILPYGKGTPNEVWVDLNTRPNMSDYMSVDGKEGLIYRMSLVARCIKAWSLMVDGKKVAPSLETLGRLDPSDVIYMVGILDEEAKKLNLSNAEKKSSSAT